MKKDRMAMILFVCIAVQIAVLVNMSFGLVLPVFYFKTARRRFDLRVSLTHVHNQSQSKNTTQHSDSKNKSRLVICVISASRPGESYLSVVLESLQKDISNLLQNNDSIRKNESVHVRKNESVQVRVVDVSNRPVREDIQDAKTRYPEFTFEWLSIKSIENCSSRELLADEKIDQPPCSVRQQTRDVLSALDQCSQSAAGDGWVTIVEDDTELCPSSVQSILILLDAMSTRMLKSPAAWRLALFSTYFSGASFPKPAIPAFLDHAWGGLLTHPIDHLAGAWAGAAAFQYPGNLFRHRGWVSSFAYRNANQFHHLYDHFRFSVRQVNCRQLPPDVVGGLALNLSLGIALPDFSASPMAQ
jgi:hypothetical protein